MEKAKEMNNDIKGKIDVVKNRKGREGRERERGTERDREREREREREIESTIVKDG